MKQRYVDESDDFFIEEDKPSNSLSLRQDSGLFDDDSYVAQSVISVRRISLPKNGEDWEIIVDKQPVLLLKGYRFSKKEREYLRSPNGMSLMINGYKNGWKTISEFKRQVTKCLK